jgi:hypothetical protein
MYNSRDKKIAELTKDIVVAAIDVTQTKEYIVELMEAVYTKLDKLIEK